LVVFSTVPRDTKQLLGQPSGPFLDLDVSPTGMQALTLTMARTAFADDAQCKPELPNRPDYCTAGFSASLKIIREVR
jgi:hypothetical protein